MHIGKMDPWLLIILAFVLVTAVVVGGWSLHYWSGLRPAVVLTLPSSECEELVFHWGLASGPEVDELCREHGITKGPLFARRGHRVVRFVPDGFHSLSGSVELADEDPDTVYFHRYNKRYSGIILGP